MPSMMTLGNLGCADCNRSYGVNGLGQSDGIQQGLTILGALAALAVGITAYSFVQGRRKR
jgi:hypothetical protein